MPTREDAVQLLREWCAVAPTSLLHTVDEIGRGTGFVLSHLMQAGEETSAGTLARAMNVSTARVAALLKTMERQELITRRTSLQDGRRITVEITEQGRQRALYMQEQILHKIQVLLERVGSEELETFIRIAGRIKAAFQE